MIFNDDGTDTRSLTVALWMKDDVLDINVNLILVDVGEHMMLTNTDSPGRRIISQVIRPQ